MTEVVSADDMDEETFLRHLRARHPESLAGPITHFTSDYVWGCYLIFHDKLHELRVDLEHTHLEPE